MKPKQPSHAIREGGKVGEFSSFKTRGGRGHFIRVIGTDPASRPNFRVNFILAESADDRPKQQKIYLAFFFSPTIFSNFRKPFS